MAQMFLFGSEIDYESGLLESGFKFKNPNVTEAYVDVVSYKIRVNSKSNIDTMKHETLIAGNWKMNGTLDLCKQFSLTLNKIN